ncbi:tRNA(Ile)-lysidine synthase [Buchnera aphidicola (Cinara cuneomaculata)]|uniref:tRNA(Ile)-lysidine synthase n=1 Tax=Buchnera aphidicola (Cinara cuneomaculata) TaxID=1660040 RepID=A0A451CY31_9GAMM|nr:tRNA lysidine(34) synthetase TilS [Buchnera aphidicola]VFP78059.1 tRNA(Ile)-lysidine synthase [Buchnera aphidicola (Cinara cuneomaculata)]
MLIKKLFLKYPHQKYFLLALSGGVDSVVLFYQLILYKKIFSNIKIRAIHINHNLNIDSIRSQNHCKKICNQNNIDIIIDTLNIPKKNKYGIEGYARIARLKIFKNYLLPTEILLLAHNLNDQCENIFLSLQRKSGIRGLSGMSYSSVYNKITIVRPLINVQKKKIISWARSQQLIWIDDESNKNIKYDRNFLRNIILPKIYTRWPHFLKNCTQSMQMLKKHQISLDFFILHFLKKNTCLDGSLSLLRFNKLIKEVQFSILKTWLTKTYKIPTHNILKRIYTEIIINKNYHNKKIIFNKREIRRFTEKIYCIIPYSNIRNTMVIWKDIKIPLRLPNKLGILIPTKKYLKTEKITSIHRIPYPLKNTLINVCFYIKKNYTNTKNNTKIKKIWQKYNIPPWLRTIIPLLYYDNKLVSGIGVFVTNNHPIKNRKYLTVKWINKI